MKTSKKVIAFLLAVIAVTAVFGQTAYAITDDIVTKMAYVNKVNTTGTNVATDATTLSSSSTQGNAKLSIHSDGLVISGLINDTSFNVVGTYSAMNENGNAITFSGNDTSGNFEVAFLSIERDIINSSMYFKSFSNSNAKYQSIVKLYMFPAGFSDTEISKASQFKPAKDMAIVELFSTSDYISKGYSAKKVVSSDAQKYADDLTWIAKYFDPVMRSNEVITPKGATNYRLKDHSETYNIFGGWVTFVMKLKCYYDITDVRKGSTADSYVQFIVDASRTDAQYANDRSTTQSVISIRSGNIVFGTIKNTGLTKQTPGYSLRKTTNPFNVSGNVMLRFSVGVGALSAYGSVSFNPFTSYTSTASSSSTLFTNDPNNNRYHKNTETSEIPSGHSLLRVGDYYGIAVTIKDYGYELVTGTASIKYTWFVHNLHDYYDSYSDDYTVYPSLKVIQ